MNRNDYFEEALATLREALELPETPQVAREWIINYMMGSRDLEFEAALKAAGSMEDINAQFIASEIRDLIISLNGGSAHIYPSELRELQSSIAYHNARRNTAPQNP